MPPEAKKTAPKRTSSSSKKPTLAEVPCTLPTVAEESTEVSTADKTAAVEDEMESMTVVDEGRAVEGREEEKTAVETVGSENTEEEVIAEKIVEERTEEKIRKEMVVEETVTVEATMAMVVAADNAVVTEASGEDEGDENEYEDEEVEEEESEEEEAEGNKQIVQVEAGQGEVESISGDDGENDEDDPAMYMQAPMTERKKQKEFELFIGGLDKGAVDGDLIRVFGVFGEIQSVRIVKHPSTQKSKGFAFLRYANIEHTKKALAELKDGVEVKGKKVMVSASQDNDTLYMGNICKTWTRDHVLETLKGYGIEQIEDILLPDDPKSEGKIKGFAFLEFKSHSDAMAAFQRLRKPDAVFGRDISAKVGFAQVPLHPCEEDLMKVKTVHLEGIPKSWDEAKVEELCKQYGEIEKVQFFHKRKIFGFVEFSSRDSAVACVEGINNTQFGEDINVKANFAKPIYKGRLAKQSRGGFKVQKDADVTEEPDKSNKKKGKSKVLHEKKKTQPNFKSLNKNTPSKSEDKSSKKEKDSQRVQSAKGQKRGRKGTASSSNQHPPKKTRRKQNHGRGCDRSSTGYSNSSYSINPYTTHQTAYAPAVTSYSAHIYPGASVTQHRHAHLEPHAGYLPAASQVRHPYAYEERRVSVYGLQPSSSTGYVGASTVSSPYPGYSSFAGYETGFVYPSSGAYAYQRPPHY